MTPRAVLQPARFAGAAVLRTQSDARLIDMTRAGNDRAFEAIVERYRRPLLRYCARMLTPGRAEDAVQQALVNAYRALTRSENEIELRPWLFRIAHNAALNALRAAGPVADEFDEQSDARAAEGPHQALERGDDLRRVVASVKELPDNQRAAVLLQAFEGHSHEQIAAALGLTDGAVRQLLHRARATLRAAATALMPFELLNRTTGEAWAAPAAQRVAELSAGAGLAAGGAAKAGVALLTAGAIAGGATGALPVALPGTDRGGDKAIAAPAAPGDPDPASPEALALAPPTERELERVERSAARRARAERRAEERREERREEREREREREDDRSGSDDDDDDARDDDDDSSGSGDGDDSGSGSDDDRDDDSGSGGGDGGLDDLDDLEIDEPDVDDSAEGRSDGGSGSSDDDDR